MNPNAEQGEQQSADWLMSRVGHTTASRFKDVLAVLKSGKPAAARETYLWEVVIERLTGQPSEHYTSAAMQWGIDQEIISRMAYEARSGNIVMQVGFIHHPEIPMVGGSPDGLVDDDGGWESKSPYNSAYHLQTILNGMPEEHMPQVQGLMWITGRQWWDFTSFDPRLPGHLQVYTQRIPRDDAYIAMLAVAVAAFQAEAAELEARIMEKAT